MDGREIEAVGMPLACITKCLLDIEMAIVDWIPKKEMGYVINRKLDKVAVELGID